MTSILKKMHSPNNFAAPTQYPPGLNSLSQTEDELRGGRDRVSRNTSMLGKKQGASPSPSETPFVHW